MVIMDIEAVIPNVAIGRLVNITTVRQMDGDLIRRMKSVLSERSVEMLI